MQNVRRALSEARREVRRANEDKLLEALYQRWMAYGKFKDVRKR
jgi:hypothetical protein